MTAIVLALLIVALVLALLAGFGIGGGRVNLLALSVAALVAAILLQPLVLAIQAA